MLLYYLFILYYYYIIYYPVMKDLNFSFGMKVTGVERPHKQVQVWAVWYIIHIHTYITPPPSLSLYQWMWYLQQTSWCQTSAQRS